MSLFNWLRRIRRTTPRRCTMWGGRRVVSGWYIDFDPDDFTHTAIGICANRKKWFSSPPFATEEQAVVWARENFIVTEVQS